MMIYVWLGLFILFISVELATMGLTTIWFAGGAVVALIASFFTDNIVVQIVLFGIVSVVLLIFTRPIATKYLNNRTVKTNIDEIIGKTAKVLFTIDNINSTGYVSVDGMDWSARSYDDSVTFAEGSLVTVIRVEGVKLIVKRKDGEQT